MKSVVHKLIIIILIGLVHFQCFSQTMIQMEEYGGVYRIPCKVNGAKMKLIFDTGADKVCLSLSMADYLYDNDYITNEDIIGSGSSTVADGSIVNHIKINIKDIEIQGIHLKNVEAVVIDGQDAPLLLGQSAIKKLGKYSISGNKLIIGGNAPSKQNNEKTMSEANTKRLLDEARKAKTDGYYRVAIEKYTILFEQSILSPLDIMSYASCCIRVGEYGTALELLRAIQQTIESEYSNFKDNLYDFLGTCYEKTGDYYSALLNYEKAMYYTEPYTFFQADIIFSIASIYEVQGNKYKSEKVLDDYISKFLYEKKIKATDCWFNSSSNIDSNDIDFLAYVFYIRSMFNDDLEKYMIIAAAWGYSEAMDWCNKHNINYLTKPNKYSY